MPAGLQQAQQLEMPLVTPTTKHEVHDMPLSPSEAEEMMSKARWEAGTKSVLALFERGTQELAKIGILLADTKFELASARVRYF